MASATGMRAAPISSETSAPHAPITTRQPTQKAKNLESNPHCILTTGTNQLRSGLDVVVEGTAAA